MGDAKKKRQALLAGEPVCCLCGVAPADTVEHAPARVCFARKVGPEGFEFPACNDCNFASKASDQVVAFYIHSLTDNVSDFKRAFAGIKNNYPWLLPDLRMTLGEKAKFLLDRNIKLPAHLIMSAPIVKYQSP